MGFPGKWKTIPGNVVLLSLMPNDVLMGCDRNEGMGELSWAGECLLHVANRKGTPESYYLNNNNNLQAIL